MQPHFQMKFILLNYIFLFFTVAAYENEIDLTQIDQYSNDQSREFSNPLSGKQLIIIPSQVSVLLNSLYLAILHCT